MLNREEKGGGSELVETVGQLTSRLEAFIYNFQAGTKGAGILPIHRSGS